MSYRETIAELDAISRQRALTLDESLRLERAIANEQKYRHCQSARRWRHDEDEAAITLRLDGQPYHRIAAHLAGRSKDAVAARLNYLGHRRTLGGVSSI